MPVGYALLPGGESSRGRGGHGVAHGIKHPHAPGQEEQAFCRCQQQINHEDVTRHDTCFGMNLVMGHSRCLGEIEHLATDSKPW